MEKSGLNRKTAWTGNLNRLTLPHREDNKSWGNLED